MFRFNQDLAKPVSKFYSDKHYKTSNLSIRLSFPAGLVFSSGIPLFWVGEIFFIQWMIFFLTKFLKLTYKQAFVHADQSVRIKRVIHVIEIAIMRPLKNIPF